MARFLTLRAAAAGLAAFNLLAVTACASLPGSAPAVADFSRLEASATGEGFSAEGLAALDAAMADEVAKGNVKGVSTVLVKDGVIVHYTDHGIMRAADKAPMAEDTIHRIYSMSKPVTGVALMTLYEDGKFSLDDPVTRFVPEMAGLKVMTGVDAKGAPLLANPNHIPTMREIMSHTAGFAYGLGGTDPSNKAFRDQGVMSSPDLDTYIGKVSKIPLLFQPGAKWSYSTSVDIQGYIIQKISGQKLGDYLRHEIFEPLGMTDTAFTVPEAKRGRFADMFSPDPKTGVMAHNPAPMFAYRDGAPVMQAGGHGLASTLGDYARFCQMLADGGSLGKVQILKPETVELMRTNVLPPDAQISFDNSGADERGKGSGFGLDFGIVVDPAQSKYPLPQGSYYWGGAAGTWFWIDPVNNLFFIGMIQRMPGGGIDWELRRESAAKVYAAMEK